MKADENSPFAPIEASLNGSRNGKKSPEPVRRDLTQSGGAEHDYLSRRRDGSGDRLPDSYAFSVPSVSDAPLEETSLATAIAAIAETLPLRAAEIRHFYDHKLREALRRFRSVLAEESERIARSSERAAETARRAEAERERLVAERDAATREDADRLRDLEEAAVAAHREAADRVSLAGGLYDPENPSEEILPMTRSRTLEAIAAEMELPWPPSDDGIPIPPGLSWSLTLLVGAMVGCSLGIMAGSLHGDTLGARWPLALAWSCVGFAAAAGGKFGIRSLWHLFSQDQYLGLPLSRRIGKASLACLISLLLTGSELVVERNGMLSLRDLFRGTAALSDPSLARRPGSSLEETLSLWLAPAIVTLGYFVCAGAEGYVSGRRASVMNRLKERQERETAAADAERRGMPETQAAMRALADVRNLLGRERLLRQRVSEAAAPYDEAISQAETEGKAVRALPVEWDEAALLRIQDALDNYHGAQEVFDAKLAEIISEREPLGGEMERPPRDFRERRQADRDSRVVKRGFSPFAGWNPFPFLGRRKSQAGPVRKTTGTERRDLRRHHEGPNADASGGNRSDAEPGGFGSAGGSGR